MRSPLTAALSFVFISLLSLTSCKGIVKPDRPTVPQNHSEVSLGILEARIKDLERQINDMRAELERFRTQVNAQIDLRFREMRAQNSTLKPQDDDKEAKKRRELSELIAKNSDAVRMWGGKVGDVSVMLYPITKGEALKEMNDQFGKKYIYLFLYVTNNNPTNIWSYEPEKGMITVTVEKAAGKPSYILCRDPLALIKAQERSVGGGEIKELRAHFGKRFLRPGQSMATHVIFEAGLDFSKVEKIYWGEFLVPEEKLPRVEAKN